MRFYLILMGLCALLFSSCAKPGASQHATVVLRDGTQVSGLVTASTASDVSLDLDNNGGSRTIPMSQVRSINYDDATTATSAPAGTPPAQARRDERRDEGHERHYHPERSAIQSHTLVVPVGTEVQVRSEETIDSGHAVQGQTFAAEVAGDVHDAEGAVVIPRGANAVLVIKSASKGGHIRGASDLVLDLQSVSVEGQQYTLDTSDVSMHGRNGVGANKRTAEFAGGGAAVGAIIGAIAGHGKGAAIGAASGAGAGTLTEVVTKGTIKVPAETILTFKLDQALQVTEAR